MLLCPVLGTGLMVPLAGHPAPPSAKGNATMTTKARTPKSPATTAVPAVPASPALTAQAPAAPCYALTAKQPRQGNTLQGAKSGLGKAWHTAAKPATNTRQLAYMALQDVANAQGVITQADALAALAPVVAGTSGTPRSYLAAFVASGYLAVVA